LGLQRCCASQELQEFRLFLVPTEPIAGSVPGGLLGGQQLVAMDGPCMQLLCEKLGVSCRIEETSLGDLMHDVSLADSVGSRNGEAGKQVEKEFVGDGHVVHAVFRALKGQTYIK